MKCFRKHNFLGQKDQTEMDAFPEYLRGEKIHMEKTGDVSNNVCMKY